MYSFTTINVQGLGEENKRLGIFQSLQNGNFDIIALQETHCDTSKLEDWKEEWGAKSAWTTYKSDESGVAFLFNKNLNINILEQKCNKDGRVLRVTAEIDNCKCQLVNIYGLNPITLYQSDNLFKELDNYIDPDIPPMLFGDYNMVEDIYADRKGGHPRNQHTYGLKALRDLKDSYRLVDIWRNHHPHKRQFTWHCTYQNINSRLDRIYLPAQYISSVTDVYIQHFVWSDHDMCVIKMSLPNIKKRGKGYWKLNLQYLEHQRYKDKIESFWEEWKQKINDFEDISMWWDCGKIYIRSISIQYAQEIHSLRKNRKYSLLHELKMERENANIDFNKIENIEQQLRDMEIEANQKLFIHTHTTIRETNEEPTKYFYNLLKTRQKQSTMDSLLTHDGRIVTDQSDIMAEAKLFYENLYTEETNLSLEDQNFFLQKIDKTLSLEEKEILDKDIDLEELKTALFMSKKEKTAGYDGIPYEFYQTFWHILGQDFLNVVHYSLNVAKHLPFSQTTSIVTLMYKKNDRMQLKNWRPLSLLCCDYKIISKTLSNRLKKVLNTILSIRQTCSVPGRKITHNLHYMRDVIFFCDIKKINGYVLSLDQEKAFDMLNRKFLIQILKKMNFNDKFIEWIEVLLKDTIAHVLINGYISIDFLISRGAKQGCPLSADLYSIYIEVLGLALEACPHIYAIPIPGRLTFKSILFADDLTLPLSDRTSLTHVFLICNRFQNATGSKINNDKTQGLKLGNPNLTDPNSRNINWKNNEGIEILGIHFLPDIVHTTNLNWRRHIKEMKAQLQNLKFRKLSLKGKVLILNSVVLPKIWYTAAVLPLTNSEHKIMEQVIFDFLWNGNINPIQRKTVYQPKEKGGLGLKNPKLQQQALQLNLLKDTLDLNKNYTWNQFPRYWLGFHLAEFNQDWTFLRGNNFPRPYLLIIKPPYYIALLDTFKSLDISKLPELKFWTTRHFYQQLIEKDAHQPKAFTSFWRACRVSPDRMWKHIYASHALGAHQDVHFRFLHRILPCNDFIKNRFRGRGFHNLNSTCASCRNNVVETNEHMFFRCIPARLILHYIFPSIQILLRGKPFKIFKLVLNDFPPQIPDKSPKLVITIIQIAMYVIWNNRNKMKFHKHETCIEESKSVINNTFATIIKRKFDQYMPHGLAKFRENYCHTPEICDVVQNDTLQVQLV